MGEIPGRQKHIEKKSLKKIPATNMELFEHGKMNYGTISLVLLLLSTTTTTTETTDKNARRGGEV